MGCKVSPISFRMQFTREWLSSWCDCNKASGYILGDYKIRNWIKKRLPKNCISKVEIMRSDSASEIRIYVSRSGWMLSEYSKALESLKRFAESDASMNDVVVRLEDVGNVDLDVGIIAGSIAHQIEKRVSYKRVVNQAILSFTRAGGIGMRIRVAGRLAGAEIARKEKFECGEVSRHTIRQNVEFAQREARTTYGVIGIKVWLVKH